MRIWRLHSEQWVPRPLDELFPFYADAHNLERITPPWLHFRVLTPGPLEVRRGTLIDYRLRLHGVPFGWRTEIAAWEPPVRFVDRQLRGPYRLWEHEHTFAAHGERTRVVDTVRFAAPLGRLVGPVVRHEVERIFAYRGTALTELFEAEPQDLVVERE